LMPTSSPSSSSLDEYRSIHSRLLKTLVRARRASLALLLLRFRRDETRNDALRRHETAQASQFASYLTASRSLNPLPKNHGA
jgi:hypothetical protein